MSDYRCWHASDVNWIYRTTEVVNRDIDLEILSECAAATGDTDAAPSLEDELSRYIDTATDVGRHMARHMAREILEMVEKYK
jgi:hypothetical protein